jgi:phosphoglycolate phosphatase
VNIMREELGLAPLPLEKVVSFVGNGMRKLVERALEGEAADIDDAIASMSSIYRENLLEKTTLYPGVFEGVNRLRELGWSLGLTATSPRSSAASSSTLPHRAAFLRDKRGGPEFPLKPIRVAEFHRREDRLRRRVELDHGRQLHDLEAGTPPG